MKKKFFMTAFLLFIPFLLAQVEQHEVTVTNVVVPVRVLDGNRFVDNLTIADFELYEGGKLQKIEALYLVHKANIQRREELQEFNPALSRRFYLIFQMTDYNPKLEEAGGYLFNQVLLPGDTLTIMTPMDTYNLSSRALQTKPKESLSQEMKSLLRKDIQMGASNYRSLMADLKRIVASISGSGVMAGVETDSSTSMFGLESLLSKYGETLQKMEELRFIDEKKFVRFATELKKQTGQKNVFFFYQREFRPEISSSLLARLSSLHQDEPEVLSAVQNLFQLYQRPATFDENKIIAAFADSSVSFSFIFLNKEPEHIPGITMREQSEDIFSPFSKIAKATGGVVDSSQNPAVGFRNATNLSESCYLLYYSPSDYKKDGKFKEISVRVKNVYYAVTHRMGYFAN